MEAPRGAYQRIGDLLDGEGRAIVVLPLADHMRDLLRGFATRTGRRVVGFESRTVTNNGVASMRCFCGLHDRCPVKFYGRATVGSKGSVWESRNHDHAMLDRVVRGVSRQHGGARQS